MPECLRPKAIVSREELVLMQCITWVFLSPPPRAQEPAMLDRGTRGRFLCTLFAKNSTAEPGVGSCA